MKAVSRTSTYSKVYVCILRYSTWQQASQIQSWASLIFPPHRVIWKASSGEIIISHFCHQLQLQYYMKCYVQNPDFSGEQSPKRNSYSLTYFSHLYEIYDTDVSKSALKLQYLDLSELKLCSLESAVQQQAALYYHFFSQYCYCTYY